jgi:hypothetical protein
MSNVPPPVSVGNRIRWMITAFLGFLAILCIVELYTSGGPRGPEGLGNLSTLLFSFTALDILTLIVLGIWILRPPAPGAVHFVGRWAGKVLLFIVLAVAVVVFFFFTCLQIGN